MVLLQVTKPPGMASGKTAVFPVCGGIVMSSGRVLCNGGIYRTDPSFVTASLLGMYLKEPCAGRCVSHTAELLADWELVKKGEDPKWIEWTID